LVARRRAELKLSVRDAAAMAGVPPATFSRVEHGRMPDLDTFRHLVAWIGAPPERFFTPVEVASSTPAVIAEHLHADPALPPEAAEKIADFVNEMYATLARRDEQVAVHLRAAKTFTPPALNALTSLLDDLQQGLERRFG
jgi:transcriptional regulator with XRE-family HTH domain